MEVVCFRLPGHGDSALKSMNSLRTQQHFCDITIMASGKQAFRGHKVVLAACSPFLRDQFLLNPSAELQVSVLHSSAVVCALLQSCYTGVLRFCAQELVNYLSAASYLQMEQVVERCRAALSQYLTPRTPAGPQADRVEDMPAMPVIVRGSAHSLTSVSPPPDHPTSLQLHSLEEEFQPSGDTHTTNDAVQETVRPSGVALEEEDRGEFQVFQVCINDDDEDETKPELKHDFLADDAEDLVLLGDRCLDTEPVGEGCGTEGGSERDGLRPFRRRLVEPRIGRGRGFKHRKRGGPHRERRILGTGYQEAWRYPTAGEMIGGFAMDLGAQYPSSQSQAERALQGEGEADPGSGVDPSGYGPEVSGGQGIRTEATAQEGAGGAGGAGEDSVAVVGSTSCSTASVACDHCELAFSSAQALALHCRATHLLYACPCCAKHFTHASNLTRHMAAHRGAKAHRCPLCHKTFTQKSTLCDHMNLHSGERPHRCAYCHVRFAHKPALRRHLKEQHGKTTAQNCLEALQASEGAGTGGGGGGM